MYECLLILYRILLNISQKSRELSGTGACTVTNASKMHPPCIVVQTLTTKYKMDLSNVTQHYKECSTRALLMGAILCQFNLFP